MKSYVTFRRHPFDQVVAAVNDDRHPMAIVPYGKFGAGLWTSHPIGLVIVIGMLVVGLVGIPEWRWFFGRHGPRRQPRRLFSLAPPPNSLRRLQNLARTPRFWRPSTSLLLVRECWR